jgi:hypothetical protein
MTKSTDLTETKRLMGALVRMKPKPHEEMKVNKPTKKIAKSPRQKRRERAVSAKPKNA